MEKVKEKIKNIINSLTDNQITDLVDNDYISEITKLIKNKQKSIHMTEYMLNFNDKDFICLGCNKSLIGSTKRKDIIKISTPSIFSGNLKVYDRLVDKYNNEEDLR